MLLYVCLCPTYVVYECRHEKRDAKDYPGLTEPDQPVGLLTDRQTDRQRDKQQSYVEPTLDGYQTQTKWILVFIAEVQSVPSYPFGCGLSSTSCSDSESIWTDLLSLCLLHHSITNETSLLRAPLVGWMRTGYEKRRAKNSATLAAVTRPLLGKLVMMSSLVASKN